MKSKLKCQKCGKTYNMLAEGICYHCDPKYWDNYFTKLSGKKK